MTLTEPHHDRARAAVERYLTDASIILPDSYAEEIGDGDYVAIGAEFLGHITAVGGLRPGHSVLDIGCGLGRVALPLSRYLEPTTPYLGLDVVPENIAWCTKAITSAFGNFHFAHLDVHHPLYHPAGTKSMADAALPLPDRSIDFAMMISVFTHLNAEMASRYLPLVSRCLSPGGRLFATFFLINNRSREAAQTNPRYPFDLSTPGPVYLQHDDDMLAATAFEEDWLVSTAGAVGLKLIARQEGHWISPAPMDDMPFQDILVFERP